MVTDMEMVLKGRFSSIEVPVDGETTSITALVSQPAIHPKEFMDHNSMGPAIVHPPETAIKRPKPTFAWFAWPQFHFHRLWF